MRLPLLVLLLHLFASPGLTGQLLPQSEDLTGAWEGYLLQNEGGIGDRFELSMQLRQNGISLQGTAYVSFNDGSMFAELRLSGHQLPNGSWKLTEVEILRSKQPERILWCYKHYELVQGYAEGRVVLSGPWWGNTTQGPCIPGSVKIWRKFKTA